MAKLRKLYSSSEAKKKTFDSSFLMLDGSRSTVASGIGKQSVASPSVFGLKETGKGEIKEILVKRIKDFRDLLQMY